MKKLILFAVVLVSSLFAEKVMVIYSDDGTTITKPIASIDSVCFEEKGNTTIEYQTLELFNSFGRGSGAGDLVKRETVSGALDGVTGHVDYSASDSARIDVKTVNSYGRSSELTSILVSVNGAQFLEISQSEFEYPDKASLLSKVNSQSVDEIDISQSEYWFVLLGNSRGNAVVRCEVDEFDPSMSSGNTGKVTLTYLILQ